VGLYPLDPPIFLTRFVTWGAQRWQVYDSIFVNIAPIMIDLTQEVVEEIYGFFFR
jgi:hypothetical protein